MTAQFRNLGSRAPLVEQVVNEIQGLIFEKQLVPGTRLPSERELCEQLGVSRTVLREAVRVLVSKGLLETRRGVGTSVREVTSTQISEPLSLVLSSGKVSMALDHVHQVRQILEVEIAGIAAQQATKEDLANLKAKLEVMEKAKNERRGFAELDSQFHAALAQTTHNPLMGILLDSMQDLLRDIRHLVEEHPHLYDEVMPGHRLIVERVCARDPEGARKAMRVHLQRARRIQQEFLASRGLQESSWYLSTGELSRGAERGSYPRLVSLGNETE
jgi:GntR family transcriptional repressor for pyruvate dehydrogenase complex